MKAYKVLNPDWTCRNFRYEVGKNYKYKGEIGLCNSGFHACINAADCFNYYSFSSDNKVCEVEMKGKIINGDDKSVCSEIRIVKELAWSEVLTLVNTGKNNTGDRNSGDRNSGYRNSGYSNSGNSNSGYSNSGNSNSGYSNSGDRNSGYRNSGYSNSGNSNSGNSNSGNSNSGDSNSGDRNSGDFNSCDYESGFLNSENTKFVRVFNKKCKLEIWRDAEKPNYFYFDLNKWIYWDYMSEEEKEKYKDAFVLGGYLKRLKYKEAWKESFKNASDQEKELTKKLPNFDAKVFFDITGIDYFI